LPGEPEAALAIPIEKCLQQTTVSGCFAVPPAYLSSCRSRGRCLPSPTPLLSTAHPRTHPAAEDLTPVKRRGDAPQRHLSPYPTSLSNQWVLHDCAIGGGAISAEAQVPYSPASALPGPHHSCCTGRPPCAGPSVDKFDPSREFDREFHGIPRSFYRMIALCTGSK
jgi:hypothetical protein